MKVSLIFTVYLPKECSLTLLDVVKALFFQRKNSTWVEQSLCIVNSKPLFRLEENKI